MQKSMPTLQVSLCDTECQCIVTTSQSQADSLSCEESFGGTADTPCDEAPAFAYIHCWLAAPGAAALIPAASSCTVSR